jgi:hypothetical protein
MRDTLAIIWMTLAFHLSAAAATVNVMVAISNQALGCIGGPPQSIAAQQVALANNGVANGQAQTTFNYVGYTTMDEAAGDPLRWLLNKGAVVNARNALKADVIVAILTGSSGAAAHTPARNPYEGIAYIGCTRFFENGFQHELGHLVGAHHQASGSDYGGNDPAAAPYNGFYYYIPPKSTPQGGSQPAFCYRTIMAYPPNTSACPQNSGTASGPILVFSNLTSGFVDDSHRGDANHRNAVSIDLNSPSVAQLRNSKIVSPSAMVSLLFGWYLLDAPHPP